MSKVVTSPVTPKKKELSLYFGVLVVGLGIATDIFDFFIINLVKPLFEEEITTTTADVSWLSSSALLGSVLGMLFFGAISDKVGRRRCLFATAALTFVGSVACAAWPVGDSLYTALICWRVMVGFGIGGEYPLSAAHAAESSDGDDSMLRVGLLNCCMWLGGFLSTGLFLVLEAPSLGLSDEAIWRTGFAGAACLSLTSGVLRLLYLEDSEEFEESRKSENKASGNTIADTCKHFRTFWRPVLCTTGCWFLFDVSAFGLGLNSSMVVRQFGFGDSIFNDTLGVFIMQCIMFPAYPLGLFLGGKSRKKMQLYSFLAFACFMTFFAVADKTDVPPLVSVVLYGFSLWFSTFLIMTTFVIPGELSPSLIKGSLIGIAAAMGKFGGFIGSYGFTPLLDELGISGVFYILAGVSLAGAALTALLPDYGAFELKNLEAAFEHGEAIPLLYQREDITEKYRAKDTAKVETELAVIEPLVVTAAV